MSEQQRSDSTTEQVKQTAQQATDKAQEMAMSQADKGKSRAASTLTGVAGAFHQAAGQMRQQNQGMYAGYIDQAANQIDGFATYLQGQNVGDMIDQVEQFGREQPILFVGGAFALGLFAARFLKASRPEPEYSYRSGQSAWSQPRGASYGTRGFGTGYPPATDYPPSTAGRTGTPSGKFGVDDVTRGTSGTTPPRSSGIGSTSPTQVTSRDYPTVGTESRRDTDATK